MPLSVWEPLTGVELALGIDMVVRATTAAGIEVGGMKKTYGYDIGGFIHLGGERTLVSDGSSSSGSA